MDYQTLKATLEAEFNDNWTDTGIAWENADLDPLPDGPWVRLTVMPSVSANAVIGSGMVRIAGYVVAQVFTKINEGSGDAYRLADKIKAIFENKQFSGIFLYATEVESIGDGIRRVDQIEQDWFQLNVTTRFEAH